VATNNPVSPEEISFSAWVIKYQGPIISVIEYKIRNGQYFLATRRRLLLRAIGRHINAPINTLKNTITSGDISSTATFKNR
jgi:hypothetical protein